MSMEWCGDDYHSNYQRAPIDGSAWIDQPKRGVRRVLRGGSWGAIGPVIAAFPFAIAMLPAIAFGSIGFRLVLPRV